MRNFVFNVIKILALSILKTVCLLIAIAYFTLAERKIMAAVQRRVGPNVVGPFGLLQPLADGLKLAGKELAIPAQASSRIFLSVAITVLLFALSGWAVIPFGMFDHSEYMSNAVVAKSLLLTERKLTMYHTTLECYYAAPESRGFLSFWNTLEDFFIRHGRELLEESPFYDLIPAMSASKDPLRLSGVIHTYFSYPGSYEAIVRILELVESWFKTLPWTDQELEAIYENLWPEGELTPEHDIEYRRIIQRRVLGKLDEPLYPVTNFGPVRTIRTLEEVLVWFNEGKSKPNDIVDTITGEINDKK